MRLIPLLVFTILVACNQQEAILPDATSKHITVQSQPHWRTEKLDDKYTIQFPDNYQGGIGPTIEGPEFSLRRNDQRVYFLAPTAFSGGSQLLPTPQPDSILYANLVLNQLVTFQRNGNTQGLFYYTRQPKSQGKLYLLRNGQLAFSMIIQYDFDLHQEILGVLQTIQPR